MSKKMWFRWMLVAAVVAVAVTGAYATGERAQDSGEQPTAVRHDSSQDVPVNPFSEASCTADCGDGSSWTCTGPSVACIDGDGCAASGGGITLIGLC